MPNSVVIPLAPSPAVRRDSAVTPNPSPNVIQPYREVDEAYGAHAGAFISR